VLLNEAQGTFYVYFMKEKYVAVIKTQAQWQILQGRCNFTDQQSITSDRTEIYGIRKICASIYHKNKNFMIICGRMYS
jgi:hypothetical protein